MGITICSRRTGDNADLTYTGFKNFRKLVAEMYGPVWARHYDLLLTDPKDREQSDDELDEITMRMIRRKKIPIRIVDFLLQPDEGGKIHYGACKIILKALDGYGEDPIYGYAAWSHPAHLSDVRRVLAAAVAAKCDVSWSG